MNKKSNGTEVIECGDFDCGVCEEDCPCEDCYNNEDEECDYYDTCGLDCAEYESCEDECCDDDDDDDYYEDDDEEDDENDDDESDDAWYEDEDEVEVDFEDDEMEIDIEGIPTDLHIIHWMDTTEYKSVIAESEIYPVEFISCGWIMQENEKFLTLYQTGRANDTEAELHKTATSVLIIPVGCIVKRYRYTIE